VLDSRYVGDSCSKHDLAWASADGTLELGFWDFRGSHTTPVHEGYEEVLVLLSGSIGFECDGERYDVAVGDVVVYDCPIPPQRLSSPGGATAAFVMRHRR
jgi:mannose-6-phosphate isomerase-like protein (cupin superfamily)